MVERQRTTIARIAALRVRPAYRREKQQILEALKGIRQKGDDPVEYLRQQEREALARELNASTTEAN